MGTCSYVLTGTQQGMDETYGTMCHGAVSEQLHSCYVKKCLHLFLSAVQKRV